jgi:hypothetical protein
MDLNFSTVRGDSMPPCVVYQIDSSDPMSPLGLLMAYAEEIVMPVVSDFDTFLVGSHGMEYEPLGNDQAQLIQWLLSSTDKVLGEPNKRNSSWTSRWLQHLKREAESGFYPDVPQYGFGDPTSIRLIADVIAATSHCGAVRHGAECFNYYFPQELDEEYLVIWEGLESSWDYMGEDELLEFLQARVAQGFTFPLNPLWPIRDEGWYQVFQALRSSPTAQQSLAAWFPGDIMDRIDAIHEKYPEGFTKTPTPWGAIRATNSRIGFTTQHTVGFGDLSATDLANFGDAQIQKVISRRWRKVRNCLINTLKL